jgi:hypothetical protein
VDRVVGRADPRKENPRHRLSWHVLRRATHAGRPKAAPDRSDCLANQPAYISMMIVATADSAHHPVHVPENKKAKAHQEKRQRQKQAQSRSARLTGSLHISRWSRAKRETTGTTNAPDFPTAAGVAEGIHSAWYLIRDTLRGRSLYRASIERWSRASPRPPATLRVAIRRRLRITGAEERGHTFDSDKTEDRRCDPIHSHSVTPFIHTVFDGRGHLPPRPPEESRRLHNAADSASRTAGQAVN